MYKGFQHLQRPRGGCCSVGTRVVIDSTSSSSGGCFLRTTAANVFVCCCISSSLLSCLPLIRLCRPINVSCLHATQTGRASNPFLVLLVLHCMLPLSSILISSRAPLKTPRLVILQSKPLAQTPLASPFFRLAKCNKSDKSYQAPHPTPHLPQLCKQTAVPTTGAVPPLASATLPPLLFLLSPRAVAQSRSFAAAVSDYLYLRAREIRHELGSS